LARQSTLLKSQLSAPDQETRRPNTRKKAAKQERREKSDQAKASVPFLKKRKQKTFDTWFGVASGVSRPIPMVYGT
jgi:hypothetical protein